MKKANIAAALSFVVPGAGLWFLEKRLWAVVNLLVATSLVLLLSGFGPANERIHYVILAVAAGSSGLAHATRTGQRRRSRTSDTPPLSVHGPSDSDSFPANRDEDATDGSPASTP
jgi:hypothetical protein